MQCRERRERGGKGGRQLKFSERRECDGKFS